MESHKKYEGYPADVAKVLKLVDEMQSLRQYKHTGGKKAEQLNSLQREAVREIHQNFRGIPTSKK